MGANVYLESCDSFGNKSAAAGTSVKHNISGRSGKRITIFAFGATCGSTVTHLYFMQTLGTAAVGTAAIVGVASVVLDGDASVSGSYGLAALDNVVLVDTNGTYEFRVVKSWEITTNKLVLTAVHGAALDAGGAVYQLGVSTDSGHLKYRLTVSVQNTKFSDIGVFFGEAKGYPMIAFMKNAANNAGADDIDFISVGYLNK